MQRMAFEMPKNRLKDHQKTEDLERARRDALAEVAHEFGFQGGADSLDNFTKEGNVIRAKSITGFEIEAVSNPDGTFSASMGASDTGGRLPLDGLASAAVYAHLHAAITRRDVLNASASESTQDLHQFETLKKVFDEPTARRLSGISPEKAAG